jgi:hypothetical protein
MRHAAGAKLTRLAAHLQGLHDGGGRSDAICRLLAGDAAEGKTTDFVQRDFGLAGKMHLGRLT